MQCVRNINIKSIIYDLIIFEYLHPVVKLTENFYILNIIYFNIMLKHRTR